MFFLVGHTRLLINRAAIVEESLQLLTTQYGPLTKAGILARKISIDSASKIKQCNSPRTLLHLPSV